MAAAPSVSDPNLNEVSCVAYVVTWSFLLSFPGHNIFSFQVLVSKSRSLVDHMNAETIGAAAFLEDTSTNRNLFLKERAQKLQPT